METGKDVLFSCNISTMDKRILIKHKRYAIPCLLASIFGIFSACAVVSPAAQDQSSFIQSSPTPENIYDAPLQEDIGLHILTAQQGIAMTVGGETDDGVYTLDPYPDATADIIFYDYMTLQCIRLSPDVALGHDPISTAYIPSTNGGARCLVAGHTLYVLKNGQPYADPSVPGNDPIARLYSMELDGSDRRVAEYDANLVFEWGGCVAGDNAGNLYTVLQIVDTDTANVRYCLAKLGSNVNGVESIVEWPGESYVSLVGVSNNGFIVKLEKNSDTNSQKLESQLIYYNLNGVEQQSLLYWQDNQISSFTVYDNILYYTQDADSAVHCMAVDSGQVLPDKTLSIVHSDNTFIECEVRDNHLLLCAANHSQNTLEHIAIDLLSGQESRLEMYAGEGDNLRFVGIFAEGKDHFLVNLGRFTRTRTDYGTDGTLYQYEQGFQDYVIIEKEDYWNNRANYQRVQYYD